MYRRLVVLVFILVAVPFSLAQTGDGGSDSFATLRGDGLILMIRHALAPGFGDPDNFNLRDCTSQRNLSDQGRRQAEAIGDWLRSKGITSARVYSSQWCRCLETAKLLEVGPVMELPALNSFYEITENRQPNLKALRKFIAKQPDSGGVIIMITHQVTISAMTDLYVSSGEGVVLELNKDTSYSVRGRIDFTD